jgi:hypothetical protein
VTRLAEALGALEDHPRRALPEGVCRGRGLLVYCEKISWQRSPTAMPFSVNQP